MAGQSFDAPKAHIKLFTLMPDIRKGLIQEFCEETLIGMTTDTRTFASGLRHGLDHFTCKFHGENGGRLFDEMPGKSRIFSCKISDQRTDCLGRKCHESEFISTEFALTRGEFIDNPGSRFISPKDLLDPGPESSYGQTEDPWVKAPIGILGITPVATGHESISCRYVV